MNSRAAEMMDYTDFRAKLQGNSAGFQAVEAASVSFSWTNRASVVQSLARLYNALILMKTRGKLGY